MEEGKKKKKGLRMEENLHVHVLHGDGHSRFVFIA